MHACLGTGFEEEEEEVCEELFTYLVSKQVKSIDGLQSSFSQAHGAAQIRNTQSYTYNIQWAFFSLTVMHYRANGKEYLRTNVVL